MFHNYLITAWRNIIKNGLFSVINILGLAIGLASCILIMLFVREETGFDRWLKDSDRLVRLHTAYTLPDRPPFLTVRSAGRMMEALRDYAKNEIEDGTRLIPFGVTVRKNEDAFSEEVSLVDPGFFNLFDLPFLHGDKTSSFAKPYDLVVSEEMALKYFGKTDVVGETLTLCCVEDNLITLAITGVIRDLPRESHLDLDLIVHMQPAMFENMPGIIDTWTSVNVYTYFKLKDGANLGDLQERIYYWVNNESPFLEMLQQQLGVLPEGTKVTDGIQHRVMAVPDLHLKAREYAGTMGDLTPMGDSRMINTFVVVALLILLIACINFMNLATARAGQRAREVAMRKVLGASRGQVAVQFLCEAIALVLISLLFALATVELVLPFYNEAIGRELTFSLFEAPAMLLALIGVALIVGVGAGLYPAVYLSQYLPAYLLKASKGAESSGTSRLRAGLVIFQFATSIGLVVITGVIYSQTRYANSMDVGYEYNNKLILNIGAAGEALESLKHELLTLADIESVVYSSESPSQDNENNTFFKLLDKQGTDNGDANQLLNYHNMGYGFFEAYDIEPLAGRLFDEDFGSDQIVFEEGQEKPGNASVILNVSALQKFGLSSPEEAIGKTLEADIFRAGKQQLRIIGVIPDIYFRSVKFSVRPSVYMLNPQSFRVASLTFSSDNLANVMQDVERVWKRNVPMNPIRLTFLSEMMAAQYESEVRETKLFSAFSVLAIFIACLGLYGLAAFTAQRRTREIGIRKVMGARVRDIVSLLIWQFSKPVIIANVIAWPVAIYIMVNWLENFPYRINTIWLLPICLGAGIISLAIAWITVGGNAARVARASPITALREE